MKMQMISLSGGKGSGDIELNDAVFGVPVRVDILSRVVEWQRAKKQAGTHSTRTIDMISGTTKKPFAQKGTGNARQGSLRAPHMRGGAVVFGPKPHSHAYALPKKIRALGLRCALSAKVKDQRLFIVDAAALKTPKTKELAAHFEKMGWKSALIIDGSKVDEGFSKAVRNIKRCDVLPQIGANVYDILRHDALVLTVDAVKQLEERLT